MIEKTKLKPGMASIEEITFIQNNVDKLKPEQIAAHLHRSVNFVAKCIAQIPKRQQLLEQTDAVEQLRASPMWMEVKRSLMPSEYDYFCSLWASYIEQFGSGSEVLATDEMSIKDLIMMDIVQSRASAQVVNQNILIEQLSKLLDKERDKAIEVRDQMAMQTWQEQVNSARGSLKSLTETHLSYQQRKDAKLDDLKATRKARFKEAQEAHQNIFGLLRELNEHRTRQREGRLMEKVRLAAEKVRQDWNQLTEFEDETVDKPFLSPEGELEDENRRLQDEQDEASEQQRADSGHGDEANQPSDNSRPQK